MVGGTPQTQTHPGGVPAPLVVTETDGVVVDNRGIGDWPPVVVVDKGMGETPDEVVGETAKVVVVS